MSDNDGTIMPYDSIQGQRHRGLKVMKTANFNGYLLCWYACYQKNYDTPRQYLNFNWNIFDIHSCSASRDLQT